MTDSFIKALEAEMIDTGHHERYRAGIGKATALYRQFHPSAKSQPSEQVVDAAKQLNILSALERAKQWIDTAIEQNTGVEPVSSCGGVAVDNGPNSTGGVVCSGGGNDVCLSHTMPSYYGGVKNLATSETCSEVDELKNISEGEKDIVRKIYQEWYGEDYPRSICEMLEELYLRGKANRSMREMGNLEKVLEHIEYIRSITQDEKDSFFKQYKGGKNNTFINMILMKCRQAKEALTKSAHVEDEKS